MTDRVRNLRDGKWFSQPAALQQASGTAVVCGALWADRVASAHGVEACGDMIVKQVAIALDERGDLVSKEGAPRHPLEVGASAMVVGTIKAATREGSVDPAECGFVSHVHPECHLSLAAVAAEVSLAHE